jgi:outer membrane lipoprotein-sorting protein
MKHILRVALIVSCVCFVCNAAFAQDATALVKQVKAKLDKVSDYQAKGKIKTDVAFLKIPVSNVQVYYKKPNRFKIKRDGGISLLPKGGVSVNMSSLLMAENFTAVAAGDAVAGGTAVKVVKLLPLDENSDVVLTTLYIDATSLLVRKVSSTTRENGTYEMEMSYGKYAEWGLPDKVIFSFNTKNYKLPKGVTMEYDNGEDKKKAEEQMKNKKGRVEITYSQYTINKGVDDGVFK